jgi:hypothetical protein
MAVTRFLFLGVPKEKLTETRRRQENGSNLLEYCYCYHLAPRPYTHSFT